MTPGWAIYYFQFVEGRMILEERHFFFFNHTFNTFYLWLFCMGHMIKDNSDRAQTHCRHYMGCYIWLTARDLFYTPSYTSSGALVGMTNSLMGPPGGIDPMIHCTMSRRSTMELHLIRGGQKFVLLTVSIMPFVTNSLYQLDTACCYNCLHRLWVN